MAYYGRGDYYSGMRGDYYRGDPFLGGLLSAGAKLAKGAISIGKTFLGIGGTTAKTVAPASSGVIGTLSKIGTVVGAATGLGAVAGLANKAFGGAEGKDRKHYRRMNPLNPKALRRALRRAEGFEKFAHRTVNALHRGPRKFKKRIPRG